MKTMYPKATSKETGKRKASSDKNIQHANNESYLIKQKLENSRMYHFRAIYYRWHNAELVFEKYHNLTNFYSSRCRF